MNPYTTHILGWQAKPHAHSGQMRFLFNGGADVPDWLLSQMLVVSRISAVKIKLLAKLVMARARGEAVDQQKLAKLLDGKFEVHEVKASSGA